MSEPESQARPQLVALPAAEESDAELVAADGAAPPDEAAGPEPEAAPAARRTGRAGWLPWLAGALALAAMLLAIGWARSAQQGDQLRADLARTESRLVATETALVAAEQRIAAWAGHAEAARTRVSELAASLSAQLGELESFLATPPDAGSSAAEAKTAP